MISVLKITAIIAAKEISKETKRVTYHDTYLWQMETAFIVQRVFTDVAIS